MSLKTVRQCFTRRLNRLRVSIFRRYRRRRRRFNTSYKLVRIVQQKLVVVVVVFTKQNGVRALRQLWQTIDWINTVDTLALVRAVRLRSAYRLQREKSNAVTYWLVSFTVRKCACVGSAQ